MRYTRYNHGNNNRKRRGGRNNFFLIGLVICIPLAIGIGTIFGPMIFKQGEAEGKPDTKKPPVTDTNKDKEEDIKKPTEDGKEQEGKPSDNVEKESFFIMQCGVYGKEENAKTALKEIPTEYNKFISKEGDKFKIIAGVFNEENSKKKSEELEKKSIVNVRIRAEIPKADENGVKLAKIVNGYMDILSKFENEETKSVNIEEFKKWTSELKSEKIEESKEIKEIKEHINKLPKSLERKDVQKSVEYLYNLLNKYRV